MNMHESQGKHEGDSIARLREVVAPFIEVGTVDEKYIDALEEGRVGEYLAEVRPSPSDMFALERVEEIYKKLRAGESQESYQPALDYLADAGDVE